MALVLQGLMASTPSRLAGRQNRAKFKQVDVFPYLKTKRLCVLLQYIKLPLVYNTTVKINRLISLIN